LQLIVIKNNYPHIRTWIAILEYADAVIFICNIYLIKFTKTRGRFEFGNFFFFFLIIIIFIEERGKFLYTKSIQESKSTKELVAIQDKQENQELAVVTILKTNLIYQIP
jgi:hypothetical protein